MTDQPTVRTDGSGTADVVGTVVESVPPERLVLTYPGSDEARAGQLADHD